MFIYWSWDSRVLFLNNKKVTRNNLVKIDLNLDNE